MKKSFVLIMFSIALNQAFAQLDPVFNYNRQVVENWKGEYIRVGPYMVKGSPFFMGEALAGNISYKGGKKAVAVKVLYDIYDQKVGIDKNNQIFEADEPIEEFVVSTPDKYGAVKLLFRNAAAYGKADMNSYLNVLEDGEKLALLKQFKTKLLPDPVNTMDKDKKIFEQYFEYYVYSKATKQLHKIKLKEKDVVREMNNDEQVKNYLSQHAVDFSKESEVISLINKYNNNFVQVTLN